MKKSRFTEAQIVAILKEGEAGRPLAELLRKHEISSATYYARKSPKAVTPSESRPVSGGLVSAAN